MLCNISATLRRAAPSAGPVCSLALLTAVWGCGSTPVQPLVSSGLEGFTDAAPAEVDAASPALEQVFADNASAIDRFGSAEGQPSFDGGAADPERSVSRLTANPSGAAGLLEVPLADGGSPTPLVDPASRAYQPQGPPADASAPAANPARPTLERAAVDQLLRAVASRLEESPQGASDPLAQAVQLSLVDALTPGVAAAGADAAAIALTPSERAAVEAWRASLTDVGEAIRSQQLDAPTLVEAARALGDAARAQAPLRIETAVLAQRVEGFGRFAPLPTPLLAGRPHPAGLYVEIEGFTRAPSVGSAGEIGFVVELGEEISLYHEPDGLLAWRRPEQIVRDFSRRPRRDFFLVDRLDLPSTLTVGSYRLKVRVTDKASGASAEAIIPFEVVADRALAGTKR